MDRRQDGSAAAGRSTRRNTRRSSRRNKVQWRNIFFQSTLTATCLPPHAQLILPAQFVDDHCRRMNQTATLKNVENGIIWTVKIDVRIPDSRPGYPPPPLVFFRSRGWTAFTIANDLAIGDQLTFALVAQSEFHVSIFRGGGNSSLFEAKSKIRSQKPIPKRRKTIPATKCRPGPQLCGGIPTDGCEGSAELARTGTLLAKVTAKETGVAAEAPDPTPSPSGVNSHCFEAVIPRVEARNVRSPWYGQGSSQGPSLIEFLNFVPQVGIGKSDSTAAKPSQSSSSNIIYQKNSSLPTGGSNQIVFCSFLNQEIPYKWPFD